MEWMVRMARSRFLTDAVLIASGSGTQKREML
jgi:hypothetical protein